MLLYINIMWIQNKMEMVQNVHVTFTIQEAQSQFSLQV